MRGAGKRSTAHRQRALKCGVRSTSCLNFRNTTFVRFCACSASLIEFMRSTNFFLLGIHHKHVSYVIFVWAQRGALFVRIRRERADTWIRTFGERAHCFQLCVRLHFWHAADEIHNLARCLSCLSVCPCDVCYTPVYCFCSRFVVILLIQYINSQPSFARARARQRGRLLCARLHCKLSQLNDAHWCYIQPPLFLCAVFAFRCYCIFVFY